MNRKQWN